MNKEKNLNMITWFKSLYSLNSLNIIYADHPLNDYQLKVYRDSKYYKYEIDKIPMHNDYLLEKLEFKTSIELKSNNSTFFIQPPFLTKNLSNIKESYFCLRGEILQISTSIELDSFENKYHSLLIPINKESLNLLLDCLDFTDFHESEYKHKVITCEILTNKYKLFLLEDSEEISLIIESYKASSFKEFSDQSYSILLASGLFSGNLSLDDGYYFSYNSYLDEHPENIHYQKLVPSILTGSPMITKRPFNYLKKYTNISDDAYYFNKLVPSGTEFLWSVSPKIFSNLCTSLYESLDLRRSALSFLSAENNSLERSIADYFIILETFANIYIKDSKAFKPIIDKRLASNILNKLTKLLEESLDEKDVISNGITTLRKRLQNINSPVNQDKLVNLFNMFNLNINEKDLEIIKLRNVFLHGSLPKIDTPFEDIDLRYNKKLINIKYKLRNWISFLYLKPNNFHGYTINYVMMNQEDNTLETEELYIFID